MAGKHAPASPWSFYFSLGRAAAGLLAVLGTLTFLVVVAFGGGSEQRPPAAVGTTGEESVSPTPSPSISESPTPAPPPSPVVREPKDTSLAVLNGSGRAGIARRTADQAIAQGYRVSSVGNAPATETSTIFYKRGFEAEAEALQKKFPGFTQLRPAGAGVPADVMLTMVIGADYP